MSLVTFVEDVSTLDESVQSFYKETEGGFILDAQPVNGYVIENVDSLKSALTKERKAVKDYEKKVKTYESKYAEIDPDEYKAAMDKLEELSSFDPEKEADKLAQEKYETNKKRLESTITKQYEAKIKNEYEPVKQKYDVVVKQLEKELRTAAAVKALAAEEGDADLLLPHVLNKLKFSQKDDGSFETYVTDDNGEIAYNQKAEPLSVQELVQSMKGKFPGAFKSTAKSGGGAQQSKGKANDGIDINKLSPAEKIQMAISGGYKL